MDRDERQQTLENLIIAVASRRGGRELVEQLPPWLESKGWTVSGEKEFTAEEVVSCFNSEFKQAIRLEDVKVQVHVLAEELQAAPEEFFKPAKPRTESAKKNASEIDKVIAAITRGEYPIVRLFTGRHNHLGTSDPLKKAYSLRSTISARCHKALKDSFKLSIRRYEDDTIVFAIITEKDVTSAEINSIVASYKVTGEEDEC